MSVLVMSQVWQESSAKSGELLLLLAIADFANDDGYAWPSIDTLARKTRLSRRQTQNNIKAAISRGELVVHENQGPHGTHLYQIVRTPSVEQGANISPVQPTSHVQSTAQGGAICDMEGVKPTSPEPSIEPSYEPSGEGRPRELSAKAVGWATEIGLSQRDIRREGEKFFDYHAAHKNKIVDWDAAWRNWVRKAIEWNHVSPHSDRPKAYKLSPSGVMVEVDE